MAKPTMITEVRTAIDRFGPRATIVTTNDQGRPHVTTSLIDIDGDHLVGSVGTRTSANIAQRPALALVWQPPADGEYQLIIDGTVVHIEPPDDTGVSRVRIAVDSGIQHRLAGLPGDTASCRPVDEV